MNSLFYYLVTAHEHQEGYGAVEKVTELYHSHKELFESMWEGVIAESEAGEGSVDFEEFRRLLCRHGLYIQYESRDWDRSLRKTEPEYEMALRIYPVEIGKVACLKVSVCGKK